MDKKVKMSAPWYIYFEQIKSIFEQDPEIDKIIFDNEKYIIRLYINNKEKAEAIEKILPDQKVFGNIIVNIEIIPNNISKEDNKFELIEKAFEGNPIISEFIHEELFDKPIYYVVFKKEVVQYYSDDLSDAHGVTSTLYQDIAKEIIGENEGIYFCTDIE